MKRFKGNDLINASYDNLRFIARCPKCGTKVKGRPSQFKLSSVINKALGRIERAEFVCPCCERLETVRIDQIAVVEEVLNVGSLKKRMKPTGKTVLTEES